MSVCVCVCVCMCVGKCVCVNVFVCMYVCVRVSAIVRLVAKDVRRVSSFIFPPNWSPSFSMLALRLPNALLDLYLQP